MTGARSKISGTVKCDLKLMNRTSTATAHHAASCQQSSSSALIVSQSFSIFKNLRMLMPRLKSSLLPSASFDLASSHLGNENKASWTSPVFFFDLDASILSKLFGVPAKAARHHLSARFQDIHKMRFTSKLSMLKWNNLEGKGGSPCNQIKHDALKVQNQCLASKIF